MATANMKLPSLQLPAPVERHFKEQLAVAVCGGSRWLHGLKRGVGDSAGAAGCQVPSTAVRSWIISSSCAGIRQKVVSAGWAGVQYGGNLRCSGGRRAGPAWVRQQHDRPPGVAGPQPQPQPQASTFAGSQPGPFSPGKAHSLRPRIGQDEDRALSDTANAAFSWMTCSNGRYTDLQIVDCLQKDNNLSLREIIRKLDRAFTDSGALQVEARAGPEVGSEARGGAGFGEDRSARGGGVQGETEEAQGGGRGAQEQRLPAERKLLHKMLQLREKHNEKYPPRSRGDAVYDFLTRKLRELEARDPQGREDSPTGEEVGAPPLAALPKVEVEQRRPTRSLRALQSDPNDQGRGNEWIQEPSNRTLVNDLKMDGVDARTKSASPLEGNFEGKALSARGASERGEGDDGAEADQRGSVRGKSIVVTGQYFGEYTRMAMEALVKEGGGRVTKEVSSKTAYVIRGQVGPGHRKLEKAAALGIAVLDWAEALHLLGHSRGRQAREHGKGVGH